LGFHASLLVATAFCITDFTKFCGLIAGRTDAPALTYGYFLFATLSVAPLTHCAFNLLSKLFPGFGPFPTISIFLKAAKRFPQAFES
jgi:hypothetical protein